MAKCKKSFKKLFFKNKGQVSIEFLVLLIMSVFFVLTFVIIVKDLSDQKLQHKALDELDDLGKSLQQEILLSSQLEDGYSRDFYVPEKLYGISFTMNVSVASGTIMYLNFYHDGTELFYAIPYIQGTIMKGTNTITKQNNLIVITQ